MNGLTKIAISLLPVFLFLAALILLDSYKLVKLRAVLKTIAAGCLVAIGCLFINDWLMQTLAWEFRTFSKYGAPLVEEVLKAGFIIYLVSTKKVGFMVDAAIHGFAIGAGFSLIENLFYLETTTNATVLVWIVRGFGTAIMHGTATAVFAIITKTLVDRGESIHPLQFLPGLLIAVLTHSIYNHFFLPPILVTLGFVIVLPLIVMVVFERSEKATQAWLGIGFDSDIDLLDMITRGDLAESRLGQYLTFLKSSFPGEVVADMLCFLRIHLELAVRAKGTLLMRENGFKVQPDPNIKAKFEEMRYLEKNIGKTGKLAIMPLLHTSHRDLWQIYMLS